MRQLLSLLLFIVFLFLPSPILAQVVLNEVHPNPNTGNDWIELKNTSSQDVNLSGWTIQDSASLLTVVPSLSSQILAASNYLVVEVGTRLNNTGDQVKLYNPAGQLVDSFTYTQSSVDQSWARSPDGTGIFLQTTPTRGATNSAVAEPSPSPISSPSPTPSPSSNPVVSPSPQPSPSAQTLATHIVISEIMACPNTGESEWVELQNLDNTTYTLNNWQLKDSQNNSRYFTQEISAQSLIVIQIAPAMLNNTGGDQVSIVRPDGVTTSWAEYSDCTKGKSLTLSGNKWVASNPSPGYANPEESPEPESVSQAEDIEVIASFEQQSPTPAANLKKENQNPEASTSSAVQKAHSRLLLSQLNSDFLTAQVSSASSQQIKSNIASDLLSETDKKEGYQSMGFQIGLVILFISCAILLSFSIWVFYTWYTEKHAQEADFFS